MIHITIEILPFDCILSCIFIRFLHKDVIYYSLLPLGYHDILATDALCTSA